VARGLGRALRLVLLLLAWTCVLVAAGTAVARLTDADGSTALALVLALLPLSMLPCYPVALGALLARRWLLALAAAVLAAAHLAWVWPSLPPAEPVSSTARLAPTMTVMSFNVGGDRVDVAGLGRLVQRERPDVLVLLELEPGTATGLEAQPVLASYPHRLLRPAEAALDGAGIYSRLPLGDPAVLGTMPAATVVVGSQRVRVQAVHVAPPLEDLVPRWLAELEALRTLADRSEAAGTPLVLAGDFNAGRHHPAFRRLLDAGLRDAHDARGRGPVRTWPAGGPVPLLHLDHVLVSDGLAVLAVTEGPALGSDHVPVVADLAVTRR